MQLENTNWIQASASCDAPCFRKVFQLSQPANATIAICGLGFYELYINGHRIGDTYFVPVTSDYHQRDTTGFLYPIEGSFTHRTYYDVHDVGKYLISGKNVIAVALGNGWYNQKERIVEGHQSFGEPRLAFRLVSTGEDATVISDETVRWHDSEVTFNNLFYGETHDLRLHMPDWQLPDYDDSDWQTVTSAVPMDTTLCLSDCPGDKVIRAIIPTKVSTQDNRSIYDAGENITGWVKLTGKIPDGKAVTLRHADALFPDGTLNFEPCGGINQIQTTEYIGDGQVRTVHPQFTWQAFRYVEVTGEWEGSGETPLLCEVVHGDIRQTSSFHCSNETLNWLYDAYIRTQLTNIHAGVPLETPDRERLGYTGDGHLGCEAAMLTLDVEKLYKKWIRDVLDCQDKATGRVQHTAPFQGGGGGPAAWGAAIVEIPYRHYVHYRDTDVLRDSFEPMLRWFDYLESRSENDLVVSGEPGGWCLGEWNSPGKLAIPVPFVNTYFYVKSLHTAAEIAQTLGMPEKALRLQERAEHKKAALISAYYNEAENSFCGGVQAADAFAADIGLANSDMLEALNSRYAAMNEFDTGIFGTDILIRVLFENGYAQTAYRLLTADGPSTFETMRRAGATTLWESFVDKTESRNHPMFGAVVRYLFTHFLGIRYSGSSKVEIRPEIVEGLDNAEGMITTIHGTVGVKYKKSSDGLEITVDCSQDMSARLHLAGESVDITGQMKRTIPYAALRKTDSNPNER